jgi:hypothetical protein
MGNDSKQDTPKQKLDSQRTQDLNRADQFFRRIWEEKPAETSLGVDELKQALDETRNQLLPSDGGLYDTVFSVPSLVLLRRFVLQVRALALASGIKKTHHVYLWNIIKALDKKHSLHLKEAVGELKLRLNRQPDRYSFEPEHFFARDRILKPESSVERISELLRSLPNQKSFSREPWHEYYGFLLPHVSIEFTTMLKASGVLSWPDRRNTVRSLLGYAAFKDVAANYLAGRQDAEGHGDPDNARLRYFVWWFEYLHVPGRESFLNRFETSLGITDDEWTLWQNRRLAHGRRSRHSQKTS